MSLSTLANPFARLDPRVYKAGRPAYSEEAAAHQHKALVATFGSIPVPRALDVGAGTGLFTSLLVPFAEQLIAADPVEESISHIEIPGI
jgi:ubiquinone/menaquinone biosynthesis C-methylase UbiE